MFGISTPPWISIGTTSPVSLVDSSTTSPP
jgi:hypothetical protein